MVLVTTSRGNSKLQLSSDIFLDILLVTDGYEPQYFFTVELESLFLVFVFGVYSLKPVC